MTGPSPQHLRGVADLVAVMDRLRSPGGCPWDAEQTHESLVRYALEEAYEVAEAVEGGDRDALREELGDLLLQVVFHARIAIEHPTAPFDVDDVAAGIAAKLRRRHPHVFGTADGGDAGDDGAGEVEQIDATEVRARWDRLKLAEHGRTSVFDGVPTAMPALARAQKVLGRAHRAELGPPTDTAAPADDPAGVLGRELLALVERAEALGVDAEQALRATVRSWESDLRSRERASTG